MQAEQTTQNTFNTHQVMGNGIFKEGTVRPLLFGLQRLRGKSRRGTRFDITGATRGESTPCGVPSNPTTLSPDHLTRTLDEASHLPQSLQCSNNAVQSWLRWRCRVLELCRTRGKKMNEPKSLYVPKISSAQIRLYGPQ